MYFNRKREIHWHVKQEINSVKEIINVPGFRMENTFAKFYVITSLNTNVKSNLNKDINHCKIFIKRNKCTVNYA